MRIGIDLDEVLCEFLRGMIEFHNKKEKTSFVFDDFFSYSFWEVWGGSKEDTIKEVYEFHESDLFKNLIPVRGAVEAVKSLSGNHELFIITARQYSAKKETLNWLSKYFEDCFNDVIFVNHLALEGTPRSKGDVCDELNIDVMIEDSGVYAEDCLRGSRRVFLFNKPWNKKKVSERIVRVNSWDEVVRLIED